MWTTTIEPWWTTTKSRLSLGVVSVARGSQQRECNVLENFAWLLASKMAEIAVLGLIRVSQENWKFFFVILVKYFIILSNLEAFSR